eukprot:1195588-Prorocentrum_minimum.AAC.10
MVCYVHVTELKSDFTPLSQGNMGLVVHLWSLGLNSGIRVPVGERTAGNFKAANSPLGNENLSTDTTMCISSLLYAGRGLRKINWGSHNVVTSGRGQAQSIP